MIEISDQLDWFIPRLLRIEDKLQILNEINQLDIGILIRNSNTKKGISIFKRGRSQRVKRMNEASDEDKEEQMNVFERLQNQKYKATNVFDRLIKEKHRV